MPRKMFISRSESGNASGNNGAIKRQISEIGAVVEMVAMPANEEE